MDGFTGFILVIGLIAISLTYLMVKYSDKNEK